MLDCVLINPVSIYHTKAEKDTPFLYNGTLSIASVLEAKGLRARVVDMVIEDNFETAVDRYVGAGKETIKIVGITVMTAQLPSALAIANYVKKNYPAIPVIFGGIHATLFPEDLLNSGAADYVCAGEGEYALFELIEAIKHKTPVDAVRGLFYKKNGAVTFTGGREDNVIDDLPFFNYETIDYERYRDRQMTRGSQKAIAVRFGSILTGMGCPYKCTFCINSNKLLYCGRYRQKSAKRILDEIEFLVKKYGIDFFDLTDENFFIDKKRVREFLAGIAERKLNFKWFTSIRADYISEKYVGAETLGALRAAGCYRLGIGAESGSQRILDKLKKGITTNDIYRSAEMLAKEKIGVSYSFMMGVPGETKEDVLSTVDMIGRLRAGGDTVAIIGPQIFRPYPGGELFDECVRDYGYKPPRGSSEWMQALNSFTGYEDVENLTWIGDKKILKIISFYSDFANLNIDNIKRSFIKKLLLGFFRKMALTRLKRHWFFFCVEMRALFLYKRLRAAMQRARAGG